MIEKWQQEVPGVGIKYQVNVDMLKGLATFTFDDDNGSYVWHYFPETHLSLDPKTRFDELFAFKDTWTIGDLDPYIETISNSSEFLIRYATVQLVDNVKMFSKKQ